MQTGVPHGEAFGSVGGCLRASHLVEIRDCNAHCQGDEHPKSGHISAHKMVMHTHTNHKTAQQSRGGMMDRDRRTEGGASSEPAFDVSQVCLRVRGLFGLTGEFGASNFVSAQIERGQGGAGLEHNDVTCDATTAVGSVSVRRADWCASW